MRKGENSMPKVLPRVELITYTPNPEETIATAAKLCYSDATIEDIKKGVESKDISKFIARHQSHAQLTP